MFKYDQGYFFREIKTVPVKSKMQFYRERWSLLSSQVNYIYIYIYREREREREKLHVEKLHVKIN